MISASISQNKGKKNGHKGKKAMWSLSVLTVYITNEAVINVLSHACCLKIKHDPANHFAYAFTIQVAAAN